MKFPRASGILLHPTSLPGEHGIGDLGPQALKFVDFLAGAKQTYWQILPLGPTGWGDSPYSSFSAFAGNTLLISPEKLIEDRLLEDPSAAARSGKGDGASVQPAVAGGTEKLLDDSIRSEPPTVAVGLSRDFGEQVGYLQTKLQPPVTAGGTDRVDYGAVYESKNAILLSSFENFQKENSELRGAFETFLAENASWLDDYALYRAIKFSQDQKPWYEWDEALKLRDEGALNEAAGDLSDEILAQKFYQFIFFRQWLAVKEHANTKGVKIVGDVPIFVALDSADVWRHRDKFKLNEDGSPKVVSGVPPDYFSKTGQLWGNPIYDWDAMRADGFSWWTERVRYALKTVDILRIDHFRGFAGAWEVPGGNPTAEHGAWVDAPGRELFEALKNALGDLPFWVEDLGFMTPEVDALRDDLGLPGMRILQFAFGGDANDGALPHNYIRNCIVYTGTHDNDTVIGWWNAQPPDSRAREFCSKYLGSDGEDINWDMIRAAWASIADTAIAPLQDVLGLDNDSRMNLPASTSGNWQWRFREGDISDEMTEKLRAFTQVYGRES